MVTSRRGGKKAIRGHWRGRAEGFIRLQMQVRRLRVKPLTNSRQ
jgi:hypothetical protein